MRNWGVIVTGFYLVLLAALTPPLFLLLADDSIARAPAAAVFARLARAYTEPPAWIPAFIWLAGPALLLWARVDTTAGAGAARRGRRRHVLVSAIAAGFALALLAGAAILNVITAISLDAVINNDPLQGWSVPLAWIAAWLGWALLLHRRADRLFDPAHRIYRWLIAGSVLELLIAVPTHLIVRRQDRCTDPVVTAFGVVTGLAILLMSLGPAAYFLYRARARRYESPKP